MTSKASVQIQIAEACDSIKELLLMKNHNYGNSALDPCRIFSNASAVEQLLVRIDDKLSRVKRGAGLIAKDEDVINDLIGYLFLLKIALANQEPESSDADVTYSEVVNFYKQSLWDGQDIEPLYGKNLRDTIEPGTETDDDWIKKQLMGHRSPD